MKHKPFSICRYNFPKNIVENTTLVKEFNDNGSINKSLLIKRGIGSENLSEVVVKMFELSKSNGNQKLLTGQNVYYATNYPVKEWRGHLIVFTTVIQIRTPNMGEVSSIL